MDRIELDGLRPAQRFDAWQVVTQPFFDISCGEDRADGFDFRMGATHWGEEMLVIETEVSGHRYVRTDRHARVGGFDQIAFQFYRSGSFAGRYGDENVVVGAGDINVLDFTQTVVKESRDQSDIDLILPRDLVRAHFPAARHGAVLGSRAGLGRLAATHLHGILESAAELGAAEATSAAASFLILLAQGDLRSAPGGAVDFARSTVRRAAETFMRREMARSDLSVDAIARHCAVSRATLFRVFEPEGGVRARLLRLRLEAARALLEQHPSLSVQDAGDRCGLPDPSGFARQFRTAFGMTPSEARTLAVHGQGGGMAVPERWIETVRRLRDPSADLRP